MKRDPFAERFNYAFRRADKTTGFNFGFVIRKTGSRRLTQRLSAMFVSIIHKRARRISVLFEETLRINRIVSEIHIGSRVFAFGVALIDLHKARKTGRESITNGRQGEDVGASCEISLGYCLCRLERRDDFISLDECQRISMRDATRFGLLFYYNSILSCTSDPDTS